MTLPPAPLEKREFYRLRLPLPERPMLLIGERTYSVLDCSARGLCFTFTQQPAFALGDSLEGWLQFRRHISVAICGLIVRIQHHQAALYLPDSEIPFTLLRAEERYLLRHYPNWGKPNP